MLHVNASLAELLRLRSTFQAYVRLDVALMDMCHGDPAAALLLSYALDLYVVHAGTAVDGWWPMPWAGVTAVTRLPPKRAATAMGRLKALGFIQAEVRRVPDGRTGQFVRLSEPILLGAWMRRVHGGQK
jgi:hypothetical protein